MKNEEIKNYFEVKNNLKKMKLNKSVFNNLNRFHQNNDLKQVYHQVKLDLNLIIQKETQRSEEKRTRRN